MGRKRTKEIIAGSQLILYLPQDIDQRVLKYLNEQANISKALLELAYDKVYNRSNTINESIDINGLTGEIENRIKANTQEDIKTIVAELVGEELKRLSVNKSDPEKKPENNRSALMRMNNDAMFKD